MEDPPVPKVLTKKQRSTFHTARKITTIEMRKVDKPDTKADYLHNIKISLPKSI